MRYLMLIVGFLVGSMATAAPSRDRSGDVTPLLKMSLDEVAAQVPIGSGFQFIGCPNCNGGSQENGVLEWKPGMGDTVKCRFCGMTFPNEKFPNNKETKITAPDYPVKFDFPLPVAADPAGRQS